MNSQGFKPEKEKEMRKHFNESTSVNMIKKAFLS